MPGGSAVDPVSLSDLNRKIYKRNHNRDGCNKFCYCDIGLERDFGIRFRSASQEDCLLYAGKQAQADSFTNISGNVASTSLPLAPGSTVRRQITSRGRSEGISRIDSWLIAIDDVQLHRRKGRKGPTVKELLCCNPIRTRFELAKKCFMPVNNLPI